MNRFIKIIPIATIVWLAGFTGVWGCKKPPSKTKGEVMQERLEERIQRWEHSVNKICQDKILEEASAIVDSTLLVNARLKRDTSDMPAIPGRPVKPEFQVPEDTTPVKPLLSGNRDSLTGQ